MWLIKNAERSTDNNTDSDTDNITDPCDSNWLVVGIVNPHLHQSPWCPYPYYNYYLIYIIAIKNQYLLSGFNHLKKMVGIMLPNWIENNTRLKHVETTNQLSRWIHHWFSWFPAPLLRDSLLMVMYIPFKKNAKSLRQWLGTTITLRSWNMACWKFPQFTWMFFLFRPLFIVKIQPSKFDYQRNVPLVTINSNHYQPQLTTVNHYYPIN